MRDMIAGVCASRFSPTYAASILGQEVGCRSLNRRRPFWEALVPCKNCPTKILHGRPVQVRLRSLPQAPQVPFVNFPLLWLQAVCHLFASFHLPSRRDLPSILIESRPARLVMAVTDF